MIASSLAMLLGCDFAYSKVIKSEIEENPSAHVYSSRTTQVITFDQDNQTKQDTISPIASGNEVDIIFNHTDGNFSLPTSTSPNMINLEGGKLQIDINAENSTNTINAGLNFSSGSAGMGGSGGEGVINFNKNGILSFGNSAGTPVYPNDQGITSQMTINILASGDSRINGGINFNQEKTIINFSNSSNSKLTIEKGSGSSQFYGLTEINFNYANDTFEIVESSTGSGGYMYNFQAFAINLNNGADQQKNKVIGNLTSDTVSSGGYIQSSINFNADNAYLVVDGKIGSSIHIASMPNETTRGLQINFLQGNGTLEIKPSTPSSNPGYPTMDSEIHDISGAIINIGNTNNEAHAHIISDFSSGSSTSRENYIIFQHDNSSLSVDGTFGSMNSMGSSMGKNTIRLDGANIAYVTTDLVGNYYNSYPSSPTIERPKNIIEIDSGKTLKLSSINSEIPGKSIRGFNIVFKGETGSFVGNLAGGVVMDFGEINNGGYPSNPPSFYTQTITFEGSIDTIYNGKYSGDNIFSFNSSPNQGMRDIVINSSKALRLNHQGGYANVFELAGSSSPSSSYGQNVTINTDIYLTGTLSQYPNPNPPGSTTYRREGNIFNIAGGRLTLGGKDDRKTLYTQSGLTQINFNSSGGNYSGYFDGNISTTGGTTKIILGYDGGSSYGNSYTFVGDIQASNSGINRFENGGSGSGGILEIQGTITASDGGTNIFTRDTSNNSYSSYSKTFFNNLVFQASGGGENIIEIYSGESFSVKKVDNTQYPSNPSQGLMLGSIETKSGTTYVNFKYSNSSGGTSIFASNLIADGGNNLITFEKIPQDPSMPSTIDSHRVDFASTLVANEGNTNTFVFNQNTELQGNSPSYQNQIGTIVASGVNMDAGNIFQIKDGISLNIRGDSMSPSLHTTSGSTRIEFLGKTGGFGGEVLTSGGVTTFALLGGDSSEIGLNGTYGLSIVAQDSGVNRIVFSGENSVFNLGYMPSNGFQANSGGQNIVEISYQNTSLQGMSDDFVLNGSGEQQSGGNIFSFDTNNASFSIKPSIPTNATAIVVQSGVGRVKFNANNGSMLSSFKVGSNTFSMPSGQTTLLQQGYVELNKENTQNALKGMSVYYDKSMGASSYTLKTNGYINFNANQTILNIADGITLDGGSLDINFNANESELNSTFSFSNDSKLGIHLREANSYNKIDQILSAEKGGIAIDTLNKSGASVSSVTFETQGFQAKTHQIDINFSGSGGTSTLVAENIVSEGANINISFIENGKIQGNLKALSGAKGQNGINAISFQKNGAIVGDISSSGGSNELHLGGGVYAIDGDVSSSGGSNRIVFEGQGKLSFLGSRTQSILASNNGKNHFYFDDTADTFTITGDVYARSSDSGVNLFEIDGGKELRFADGADTKSLVTTLGKTTISFSDTQPNKQATGSFVGNLVANGGDNEVVFSDDGVFGFRGKIEASSGNKNTFIISQNVSFANDIETSNQSSGENIFQVGNGKTLQFGENADKTLKTYSGDTIISLASSSAVKGNISAFGGQNKIEFDTSGGGQHQARIDSDFQTQGDGKNIFEISDAQISVISDSAIEFSGENLGAGFNQILFSGTNNTLSLKNIQGVDPQTFKTTSGLTHIDFEGSNSVLEANIATLGGETVFGFGDTNGVTTSVTATMGRDITNSACNTFNLYAQTVNLKLKTGFAYGDGDNIINFKKDGVTLNWLDSSGATQSIMTSGGNTVVNFSKSGSINGGIITNGSGATTTVKIADAKKGIIADDIKTSQGNTNIEFNGSSILELQGEMNQISQIAFGENAIEGTLILDTTTSAVTTTLDSIAGDKLVAQLKGASGKIATLNLNNGGTLKSINVASGTYEQNILNLKGGNTTITQAINSTAITGDGLTINLDGASKFVTTGGIDNTSTKTINISSLSGNGVISGGNINANNLDIASSSSLAFQNAQSTFASAGGEGTLILDTTTSAVTTTLDSIAGDKLVAQLKGASGKSATLNLNNGGTLKSIEVASGNQEQNILNLKGGNTTITQAINSTAITGDGLTINLDGASKFVTTGGIDNTSTKTINISSLSGNGVISGGNINANNLDIASSSSLAFQNAQSTFASAGGEGTLILDTTTSAVTTTLDSIAGDKLVAQLKGASGKIATLNLNNGGTLKSINVASGTYEQNILNLKGGNTTITQAINSTAITGDGLTINLDGASKFVTTGGIDNTSTKTINISSLSGNGVISGGNINANNLGIASGSSLAFQNAQSTFVSAGGEGTLILDGNGAKSNVSVNIENEINTNGLNVLLKGSLSGGNELVLEGGGLIKSIALSPQSINNMIFIKGENKRTTIVDKIRAGQGEEVAFNLEDQTTFVLRDGADSRLANTESKGVITLVLQGKVGGSTVALEGGDTSISNLVFQDIDSQTFRIRNANSSFGNLTSGTNQDSLLVLDTTSSGVSVNIETIIGNRLSAQFNGAINKTATLNLNNGGTLKSIEIASGNQKQNILNLKDGDTSIGEKVVVGTNKGITFSLTDGAALAFANELEIEKDGDVLFGLAGVNTIEGIVANNGVVAFDVNAPQTILNSAIDFSSGNNTINFRYGDSSDVASLSWRDVDGNSQRAINTNGGVTTINFFENGILFADLNTSKGVTNIRLADGKNAIISGTLITTDGVTNVGFDGGNSRLILKNNAIITNVVNSSTKKIAYGENNGISLYYKNRTDKVFKTLTIGKEHTTDTGIEGEGLKFLVYATDNASVSANGVYADRVVILSSKNGNSIDGSVKESTHHLGVKFDDGVKFENIGYEKGANNNILVATVADSSGVKFEKSDKTILGFVSADVDFITTATNKDGEAGVGYTSYYVGQLKNGEVLAAEQEITATAFALNYDLYMANFNSLNKRMGELRDNSHSQGVWARVFNGAQTNNMGLGSKSSYTTIQAGYDYAFGSEGANNYLGFALSYALSTSTSDKAFDDMGQRRGIEGIYSNAVEVAAYNSYVSDNGWYNDTIVKFSYLMSSFNINNLNTGSSTSNKTSNFALTLSDEIGYTFRFGNIGEWSIVPQIEAVFGYFNQSDFKQVFESSTAFLESMADSVMTMRVRAGGSLSYDFKQFTQGKDVNASIYMGAFYEYDYISGGDISYRTNTTQNLTYNTLSNIQSDGRMVINIGTNMTIKDNTRLYFDFEKSFMGNITTDYQVNFGVRYSFGESNGYTPIAQNVETQEESKAPLKIKEKDIDKEKLGSQKEKIENKKGDSSQEVQDNNEAKQEDDNNKNLNTKKNKKSIE